jgi:hypothetical protein
MMDEKTLKQRVAQTVLTQKFPEMVGIEPVVETGPAESQLRALRRRRAFVTDEDISNVPIEHKLTYHRPETADQPFDRTVVVITDEAGTPQLVIESK